MFVYVMDSLRRYRWSAVGLFVLGAAIATPIIWTVVVPAYTATAQISVSPRVARIAFQTDENGVVPLYKSYQNTQVSTILGPTVLERVLDRADVQRTRWYGGGKSSWASPLPPVQRLRESLSAKPIPETEIITVTMTAEDAGDAQLIVNAVVDQYLEVVRESFDKTDRVRFQALTEQMKEIQADIDSALNANHMASRGLGTSEPEELRSQLTTQLSTLEAELRALERERALSEWQLGHLSAAPDQPADEPGETVEAEARYGGDAEWRRLRSMMDAAQHRLQLFADRYGEAHPKLREVQTDAAYAESLLRQREAELDDPSFLASAHQSAPSSSGIPSAAVLGFEVEKARHNEQLLRSQITSQRDAVARASDLAQELAMSNERIKRKRELYDAIHSRLQELDVERNAPARISLGAYALKPALPSKDRRVLFTLMAVFGALALGAGQALMRHRFDPSLHRANDVESSIKIPFLGQVPRIKDPAQLRAGNDYVLCESLRMIRTALLERVPSERCAKVLITSPTPETGKTTMTALLGRSIALLGKRVLVIDADLRRPVLAERLGLTSVEDGLTAILHGQRKAKDVIVPTDVERLDLLAAGRPISDQDPELLAGGALSKCLNELCGSYDYILLDSPPVLSVADARILAGHVDGAVLAVKASHTRRSDVGETLNRLLSSGCHLFGTVLVAAEPDPVYYGYSGRYGYGYGQRPRQLEATVS